MSDNKRIKDAIRALSRSGETPLPIFAQVTVYDAASQTITAAPIDGTAELSSIRLRPENADPGILLVPKVGSIVGISLINDSEGFVAMVSECDLVIIQTTEGNVVQLQDGSLGGIPITANLVSRLNAIEQDLNTLKDVFSNWTPTPNDGGAGLKTAATTWSGSAITETEDADIENSGVIQGV